VRFGDQHSFRGVRKGLLKGCTWQRVYKKSARFEKGGNRENFLVFTRRRSWGERENEGIGSGKLRTYRKPGGLYWKREKKQQRREGGERKNERPRKRGT